MNKKIICLLLVAAVLLGYTGFALAQQGSGSSSQLNIPPAPPKPTPNMDYGNTARAAIIGERMTDASQGNADVYIDEGASDITVKLNLNKDASPYDIAGTMANFTYMLADLYSMTDKAKDNINLKVYDTAGKVIIDARFNTAKNAFDYFNVPKDAMPSQQQPAQQQPGYGRAPGYGGTPGYGGAPGYGGGNQYPMG